MVLYAIVLIYIQRTEISHSVRPLTVMQLNKASQAHTDAEWRVDDVEIGQVRPYPFLFVHLWL